jgi:hypothetical protein
MSAGKYTLFIDRGAYFGRLMTYKDPVGDPIDLTGFTARMQIRGFDESLDIWVELNTEDGGIELGGPDGTVLIEMTSYDTAQILNNGFYDILLIPPSGEEGADRFLEGKVIVDSEVTR